jgi:hypothetical protein
MRVPRAASWLPCASSFTWVGAEVLDDFFHLTS